MEQNKWMFSFKKQKWKQNKLRIKVLQTCIFISSYLSSLFMVIKMVESLIIIDLVAKQWNIHSIVEEFLCALRERGELEEWKY